MPKKVLIWITLSGKNLPKRYFFGSEGSLSSPGSCHDLSPQPRKDLTAKYYPQTADKSSSSPPSFFLDVWQEYHSPTAKMIKHTNVYKGPRPKRYRCPGCNHLFERPSTLSLVCSLPPLNITPLIPRPFIAHIIAHRRTSYVSRCRALPHCSLILSPPPAHPCPICLVRRFASVSNLNRHLKICQGHAGPSSLESSPDPASFGTATTTPIDTPEQGLPETKPIVVDTYPSSSAPTDPFASIPYGSSYYRPLPSLLHWNAYQEPDRSAHLHLPKPNQGGHASSSNSHPNSMSVYGGGEVSRSLTSDKPQHWTWKTYAPGPPPLPSNQSHLPPQAASLYYPQNVGYPDNDLSASSMCAGIQIPRQTVVADPRTSPSISVFNRFNLTMNNFPSSVEQNPTAYTYISNDSFFSLSSVCDEELAPLETGHQPQNYHQNPQTMSGVSYGMPELPTWTVKQEDGAI